MLAVGLLATPAHAVDLKANRDCRKAIGSETLKVLKQGQGSQEYCHGLANKAGLPSGICSDPTTLPFMIIDTGKYELSQTKANAMLQAHPTPGKEKCNTTAAAESLANYAGGNVADATFGIVDEVIKRGAETALGEDNLNGDKVLIDCQKQISVARRNITAAVVRDANSCMAKVDMPLKPTPTPTTFGALSTANPDCLDTNGKVTQVFVNLGTKNIEHKCGGLHAPAITAGTIPGYPSGNAVGSCSPLPSCVVEEAFAEARNLAHAIYPATNCSPVTGGRTVKVAIDSPDPLSGVTVRVDYPHFQSGIMGNGDVTGAVTDLTGTSFVSAFDSDHAVTVSMLNGSGISSGDLFSVAFDKCEALGLATCSIQTSRSCKQSSDCRQCSITLADCQGNDSVTKACRTGTCSITTATTCNVNSDCPASETCIGGNPANVCAASVPTAQTCIARTNVCEVSQFQPCGEPTDDPCPPGQQCVTQTAVTTCTVVDAVGALAEPIAGVTCTVSITEP
jgi:hypothetical protein